MVTGQPPQKRDGEIVGPRSLRLQLSEDLDRIIVRALAQDPAQRYQSMAQLEYDLVKSLWGRTRAVADLLGLHQAEARVESSPHDIDDPPSEPTLPQEASLGDGGARTAGRAPDRDARVESGAGRPIRRRPCSARRRRHRRRRRSRRRQPLDRPIAAAPTRGSSGSRRPRRARSSGRPRRGLAAAAVAAQRRRHPLVPDAPPVRVRPRGTSRSSPRSRCWRWPASPRSASTASCRCPWNMRDVGRGARVGAARRRLRPSPRSARRVRPRRLPAPRGRPPAPRRRRRPPSRRPHG